MMLMFFSGNCFLAIAKVIWTMLEELSDTVVVLHVIYLELFFNGLTLVAGVEHC